MFRFFGKYLLLILFFCTFFISFGQVPFIETKTILYKKENIYGVFIHSNGLGFSYKNSNNITGYKKFDIVIDFLNYRHDKEYRIFSENENAKGFVYGKLNNAYFLRTGIGYQNKLYDKPLRRGLEIRHNVSAGLNTAFLKPVYLYIYSRASYDYILSIEPYNPNQHDLDNIFGRAPFNHGFNKININPGVFFKTGFFFEYSSKEDDTSIKAIETGFCVDFFPKDINIMADKKKQHLFLTMYIGFYIGKKKYHN